MFCQQYISFAANFFAQTLEIHTIQDCIEITAFIFLTYKCLIWLKQDHTKNLLLSSYMYICVTIFAYLSSCSVLFHTLLISAPVSIIFALIIHQKQLQKNFILSSKTNLDFQKMPQANWLKSLLQSCLQASHHKKNIVCIIERSQNLKPLLHTSYLLQIPIQEDITTLLLASSKVTDNSILWIDELGIIQSINVLWNHTLINELIIKPKTSQSLLHEAALLLTEKTDALIFSINTSSDAHTVWYKGSCIKQNTVELLLQFINKILKPQASSSIVLKKRNDHGQSNTFTP